MLDLADFISDRGGNPNKIKESQRKRFAPESAVDEVLALYEEARRGMLLVFNRIYYVHYIGWLEYTVARYDVMQINSQLNAVQKEIGKKKKVRWLNSAALLFVPLFQ